MSVWKIIQRQFYDILSNKCFLLLFVLLTYSTLISILHFCEVWLNGNLSFKNKLNLGKNDFGNNIGTKFLQDQLCQYFPIDVVYTWVNGSDPNFIRQLQSEEKRVRKELSLACSLSDCLPSHLTAFRLSASKLQDILNKLNYLSVKSVKVEDKDWTVVRWDSVKTAEEESEKLFDVNRYSVPAFHVHWTTDLGAPSLYLPSNTIAIKGVNKSLESVTHNLESLLEHNFGQMIASIWRYPQVIFAELHSQFDLQQILKGKKWNIIFIKHVMKLNVTRAGLVLEIPSQIQPDDYSPSRYEDKEELRYSLRSLEKYAPWVRNIFIVTNGQLPHWLDLSNPRIQIVTHETIFINSSHLPTFSSPAIETHLHRIPGISEMFLYFNDDIFLGEEVLPEDFITSRGGQKVYLSWSVPDCSPVCPWSWVGDGTCDVPCNTTACDYDGEDCLATRTSGRHFHEADYLDYTSDPVNSFKRKLNRTLHLSEDYEEQSMPRIIKNLTDAAKNTAYAINTDDELNDLVESLAANKTKFTSDVIHDMFLLLKTVHVNKQTYEKFINTMNGSFYKNSILFEKLREHTKLLIDNNKFGHVPTNVKRNILNVQNGETDEKHSNKSNIDTKLKYVNPSINRMNLSRAQVGVPPIGVAERFYAYQPETSSLHQKLDTFAESLLFVNSLLNQRYGYKARKVPSHMPHLINTNVMHSLQDVFSWEYEKTSSHRFRNPQDMQFSFGYFYFLMNEEVDVPVSHIFDMFDTDESGTWSDREIRTVLTRLYDLPLQRSSVLNFETSLLYCARNLPQHQSITPPPFERYIDSKLPLVTKHLIENCTLVSDLLKLKMGRRKRYLYNLVKPSSRETTVGFHMITSNLSQLLSTLDKIRRKPKKFICLNDNMDANRPEDNQLIQAVLIDFFHSLFPKPSQFELPADFRNRYLYYNDFVVWQSKKKKLSRLLYATIAIAIVFTFGCLFHNECHKLKTRVRKRMHKIITRIKSPRRKLPTKL